MRDLCRYGIVRGMSNGSNDRATHLAVMSEPFLSYVLKGKKTIESRFSRYKIAPYQKIQPGDLVLMKRSGGKVVASFVAGAVECIELSQEKLRHLNADYSDAICADDRFWEAQEHKQYVTLVEITRVAPVVNVQIKKRDRRGWVVLPR